MCTGTAMMLTVTSSSLFPVYIVSGIAYGMIELIRRVIPRDIVGGDIQRLRYMDAVVHVLYEVAGTIGAFTSTSKRPDPPLHPGSMLIISL
jgi:hypothetical protein